MGLLRRLRGEAVVKKAFSQRRKGREVQERGPSIIRKKGE